MKTLQGRIVLLGVLLLMVFGATTPQAQKPRSRGSYGKQVPPAERAAVVTFETISSLKNSALLTLGQLEGQGPVAVERDKDGCASATCLCDDRKIPGQCKRLKDSGRCKTPLECGGDPGDEICGCLL
jgi:hypothetical protein